MSAENRKGKLNTKNNDGKVIPHAAYNIQRNNNHVKLEVHEM